MPQNYVPIFIFVALIGVLIPVTLFAAKLVRPENPSKAKLMPYECGIDPVDSARGRYTVRFYIVAILFVVFDVERSEEHTSELQSLRHLVCRLLLEKKKKKKTKINN